MMKKTRIFAGLAALLLCFQTGIRLNANAVTLAPTEEEIQNASEIEIDITVKSGDLNLNDKIDILDVITLNKAILGKENLNFAQFLAADVNKDSKIDAADSLMIMKMIVGLTI